MIDFASAQLHSLALHQVGHPAMDIPLCLSHECVDIHQDNRAPLLERFFLSSFSTEEMFQFHNDIGLTQNEMYTLAKRIFETPEDLLVQSQFIARHLHNCSTHPRIQPGEVYVAYFEDISIDGQYKPAIGIFKTETKEAFLKVDIENHRPQLLTHEGIRTHKPDKGCLIFQTEEETGYRVCVVDHLNRGNEAAYWKDEFLQLRPLQNDYAQTRHVLGMTRQFVTQQLKEEFDISRPDQIDLLNRSVEYFKKNETFEAEAFAQEVFADTTVVQSFQRFDAAYREDHGLVLNDSFAISQQAVKKQSRVFKSVLKLDKNFHVYIHGDREMIEQGTDADGRKYYKLYYREEQ